LGEAKIRIDRQKTVKLGVCSGHAIFRNQAENAHDGSLRSLRTPLAGFSSE
jgi:hypothetical protein